MLVSRQSHRRVTNVVGGIACPHEPPAATPIQPPRWGSSFTSTDADLSRPADSGTARPPIVRAGSPAARAVMCQTAHRLGDGGGNRMDHGPIMTARASKGTSRGNGGPSRWTRMFSSIRSMPICRKSRLAHETSRGKNETGSSGASRYSGRSRSHLTESFRPRCPPERRVERSMCSRSCPLPISRGCLQVWRTGSYGTRSWSFRP